MNTTSAKYETLLVSREGPTTRVTINRPSVLNALNRKVLVELDAFFESVSGDPAVRVVVLTGAGEKAFVAGADIAEMRTFDASAALAFARLGQGLTRRMEASPQVIIARVQGFALGGGCELAMACDVIVATNRSKFGQPEMNLGLIPGFGGTQRLVRRVGLAVGMDILVCGRTLTGDEALQLGLISRVCSPERLDEEVNLVIRGALKGAPGGIKEIKRLARQAYDMSLDAGLEAEASSFAARFGSEEVTDGLGAFLDKRAPKAW